MNTIEKIKQLIVKELSEVDNIILNSAQSHSELIPVISAYLVSQGGKRIRPMITLLVARMLGADKNDKAYKMAAAVEMIHTATLLHDDVIDSSTTRRGHKTANLIWGNKEAILVGDYLLAQAFCLMVQSESFNALNLLANAAKQITEAEVWQLELLHNPNMSIPDYHKLIAGKTASLFAAASGVVPHILALDSATAKTVEMYGHQLGLIFQMIDDLLDYNSTSESLGKDSARDLHEGKITLPLLLAVEKMPESLKTQVKVMIEQKTEALTLYQIAWEYKAEELTKHYVLEHYQQAKQYLQNIDKQHIKCEASYIMLLEILEYNLHRLH